MLSWVVTFLIVALIAGVLGFGGIAGASVEIAKAIFFIAVVLFLISAVVGLTIEHIWPQDKALPPQVNCVSCWPSASTG